MVAENGRYCDYDDCKHKPKVCKCKRHGESALHCGRIEDVIIEAEYSLREHSRKHNEESKDGVDEKRDEVDRTACRTCEAREEVRQFGLGALRVCGVRTNKEENAERERNARRDQIFFNEIFFARHGINVR